MLCWPRLFGQQPQQKPQPEQPQQPEQPEQPEQAEQPEQPEQPEEKESEDGCGKLRANVLMLIELAAWVLGLSNSS